MKQTHSSELIKLMPSTNCYKVRRYKIYNTARSELAGKGGSALIIKEIIKHYGNIKYDTAEIQSTIVTIQMISENITISTRKSPKEVHFNAKHTCWGFAKVMTYQFQTIGNSTY